MISILLTIKDRQDYLTRQLEELLSSLPMLEVPWEIVVYDDASSPPLKVPPDLEGVKFARGERNVGLIEARNILASLVSSGSRYLFFMDDDIFVYNLVGCINKSLQEIDNGFSCVSLPFINLPTRKYDRISTFRHIFDFGRSDDGAAYFFGGASIFDRAAFIRAGGLEGLYFIYLEEEDLALRMFSLGMKIKILYGERYLAIHDQAPGKNFVERRMYLLSNRFLFHYKFIGSAMIRGMFNAFYILVYFVKFRSWRLVRDSLSRYYLKKARLERQRIEPVLIFKFFIKRYFNV